MGSTPTGFTKRLAIVIHLTIMANDNAYMAKYMLERYVRRRLAAISQLGGKCVRCGEDDQALLEFHHRDPSEKTFTICGRLAGVSEQKLQDELSKCDLLCDDCHKKPHASKSQCGTTARFAAGCRCEACRQARNREFNEWRYRTGRRNRPRSSKDVAAGL